MYFIYILIKSYHKLQIFLHEGVFKTDVFSFKKLFCYI